jgi:hypothetical protein
MKLRHKKMARCAYRILHPQPPAGCEFMSGRFREWLDSLVPLTPLGIRLADNWHRKFRSLP